MKLLTVRTLTWKLTSPYETQEKTRLPWIISSPVLLDNKGWIENAAPTVDLRRLSRPPAAKMQTAQLEQLAAMIPTNVHRRPLATTCNEPNVLHRNAPNCCGRTHFNACGFSLFLDIKLARDILCCFYFDQKQSWKHYFLRMTNVWYAKVRLHIVAVCWLQKMRIKRIKCLCDSEWTCTLAGNTRHL